MSESPLDLPVFDISQPSTPSNLLALSMACREWGFFHITNHGISKDLYKNIYLLSSHIFSLPPQVKLKAGPSSTMKTYTPQFIASPFFESLRVSGPDFFASAQSSSDVLLDLSNDNFRWEIQIKYERNSNCTFMIGLKIPELIYIEDRVT